MNCPKCGAILPQGANACPVCGTPVAGVQSFSGYPPAQGRPQGDYRTGGYQQQGYPGGYQQGGWGYDPAAGGFDPAANGQNAYGRGYDGYPQGYRQVYGRYSNAGRGGGEFMGAVANLPRVARGIFTEPGETLRAMMEGNDRYTGGIVAGLSLLLTFLAAILVTRSAIAGVYAQWSALTGSSLAANAASMNQGVNYIAGKMAASVGGIAALCQLIALMFPAAVTLTYLCVIKKVRFSFLLASNLVAIVTLPTVGASLLCMVASLITPYLGAVMVLIGEVASYVLLCALIAWATGRTEQRLVVTKIAVVCASELLKILFLWLVGGALTAAALHTVSGLVNNLGSLM